MPWSRLNDRLTLRVPGRPGEVEAIGGAGVRGRAAHAGDGTEVLREDAAAIQDAGVDADVQHVAGDQEAGRLIRAVVARLAVAHLEGDRGLGDTRP